MSWTAAYWQGHSSDLAWSPNSKMESNGSSSEAQFRILQLSSEFALFCRSYGVSVGRWIRSDMPSLAQHARRHKDFHNFIWKLTPNCEKFQSFATLHDFLRNYTPTEPSMIIAPSAPRLINHSMKVQHSTPKLKYIISSILTKLIDYYYITAHWNTESVTPNAFRNLCIQLLCLTTIRLILI